MHWCRYYLPNTEFTLEDKYDVRILTECMVYPKEVDPGDFAVIGRCVNCEEEFIIDYKSIDKNPRAVLYAVGCPCVGYVYEK
jgi:hypothetical protein